MCAVCGGSTDKPRRGLCTPCYMAHHYRGLHLDFESRVRRSADVLDEWRVLRARGYQRREVARQLGMTLPAFERACTRARQQAAGRAA